MTWKHKVQCQDGEMIIRLYDYLEIARTDDDFVISKSGDIVA